MFRMQPVHGGDPKKCPVIGALDVEGISATADMVDFDREIRLVNADAWGRGVQDFPAAEYAVPGLTVDNEKKTRDKNISPLRIYPPKKPEKFAYYRWKDEFKLRLRYIPNVQTSNLVPFVLVLTGPHMPVFVIPLHLLFDPFTLFSERLRRGEYYQTTGDPDITEVDADTTPSIPSQWALDELSGAADRSLGYCGKVWLVVDIRSELAWLTKAFSGVTVTRTSYSGSPGTDTYAEAKPKLGFYGREGGPKSNCYIPCIGVEECLRATGDEDYFQAIDSQRGVGKVPEFKAYGVVTILQWVEGHRHLTHPSLHWILRQQIGEALDELQKRFKIRLHEGQPRLRLQYLRGPPEAQPTEDDLKTAMGEVVEGFNMVGFTRYRELFYRLTEGQLWSAPDHLTEYLVGDVTATYWGFINYALRRTLVPAVDPAADGKFGKMLNPILQAIRNDCDTPLAFKQVKNIVEPLPDRRSQRTAQSRLTLGIHDAKIRGVIHDIFPKIRSILRPAVAVSFNKWKYNGMHPDKAEVLNYWPQIRKHIQDWVYRMARIPTSPRSTILAQQLVLQEVSLTWAREMTARFSDELSELFSRGTVILPPPFLSPQAVPELPATQPDPPKAYNFLLPAYISGQSITVQGPAILNVVNTRVPIGAYGQTVSIANFERRELAPKGMVWDQGQEELRQVPFGAAEPVPQAQSEAQMTGESQSSQDESPDSQEETIEEEDSVDEAMDSEEVIDDSDTANLAQPSSEREESPPDSTSQGVVQLSPSAAQEALRHPSVTASSGLVVQVDFGSSGDLRSVMRPFQFPWRLGCPPWKYRAIREMLEELYSLTQRTGGACGGEWTGPPYTGPEEATPTLEYLQELLTTVRDPDPNPSWYDSRYLARPLNERVLELIRHAEEQELSHDPSFMDISGVLDDAYRRDIFNRQDIADIMEIWIWKYGNSLLHLPQVLERYILEPIRRFHPNIPVPCLPWFLWRAHPAIPPDSRLSLRAWFAQRFGLPSLGVQTVVCSSKYFLTDDEMTSMILGPIASPWWPGAEDSYMRLSSDWLSLLQRTLNYHQGLPVSDVVGGEGLTIATFNFAEKRLFHEGKSPLTEPTPTPLFRPLRPRDFLLDEILRYNFGLVLPERFRLRAQSEDFPTTGDLWTNPGCEEVPPPPAYQRLCFSPSGNPLVDVTNTLYCDEEISPSTLTIPGEGEEADESSLLAPSTSAGTSRRVVQQTAEVWDEEEMIVREEEGYYEPYRSDDEDDTEFFS